MTKKHTWRKYITTFIFPFKANFSPIKEKTPFSELVVQEFTPFLKIALLLQTKTRNNSKNPAAHSPGDVVRTQNLEMRFKSFSVELDISLEDLARQKTLSRPFPLKMQLELYLPTGRRLGTEQKGREQEPNSKLIERCLTGIPAIEIQRESIVETRDTRKEQRWSSGPRPMKITPLSSLPPHPKPSPSQQMREEGREKIRPARRGREDGRDGQNRYLVNFFPKFL